MAIFSPFISASEKTIMWPIVATWISNLKIKKILDHWIKKQTRRGLGIKLIIVNMLYLTSLKQLLNNFQNASLKPIGFHWASIDQFIY